MVALSQILQITALWEAFQVLDEIHPLKQLSQTTALWAELKRNMATKILSLETMEQLVLMVAIFTFGGTSSDSYYFVLEAYLMIISENANSFANNRGNVSK